MKSLNALAIENLSAETLLKLTIKSLRTSLFIAVKHGHILLTAVDVFDVVIIKNVCFIS